MEIKSRTYYSFKNIFYSVGSTLLLNILSFVSRTIFIKILGAEYLGINGLFTNVLSMLSLAELGIGTIVVYSLYEPLLKNDHKQVMGLMNFYARIYTFIGGAILLLGIILIPFLDFFMKEKPDIPNLILIYLFFLANSVASYFYIYKSALLNAAQKSFLIITYQFIFKSAQIALQILVLTITKNYILYLIIQIIFTIFSNFFVSYKTDNLFVYLKGKNLERLSDAYIRSIWKNTGAMVFHKVGAIALNSVSSLFISKFIGIISVGIYSNYQMIILIIQGTITNIFSSITPSVGNLNAEKTPEKSLIMFNNLFFINFWIVTFCSISLLILLNPFISIWIGTQYIFNGFEVVLIVAVFYLSGMRYTVLMFKNTYGLFWNDRYKPIAELVVMIIVSLLLVRGIGLSGIFLALIISTLTTCFWVEPYVLFKHGFADLSKLKIFFSKYLIYFTISVLMGSVTFFAVKFITGSNLTSFIKKSLICLIVPNLFIFLIFKKSDEYNYLRYLIALFKKKT